MFAACCHAPWCIVVQMAGGFRHPGDAPNTAPEPLTIMASPSLQSGNDTTQTYATAGTGQNVTRTPVTLIRIATCTSRNPYHFAAAPGVASGA